MNYLKNTGTQPPRTKGKSVTVILRRNEHSRKPSGPWKADTARWTLEGDDFDILGWRLDE